MKGLVALFFAAIACAALAQSEVSQPAAVKPSINVLFEFFRTQAFHNRIEDLKCAKGFPTEVAALEEKFRALRLRLVERYGEKPFSVPVSHSSDPGICQIVFVGYGRAIADATQAASAAE